MAINFGSAVRLCLFKTKIPKNTSSFRTPPVAASVEV